MVLAVLCHVSLITYFTMHLSCGSVRLIDAVCNVMRPILVVDYVERTRAQQDGGVNITRVYLELQCCFVLHWLLTLAEFFSIK